MVGSTAARAALIVLASALIGFGAVYVTLGRPDNAPVTAKSPSPASKPPTAAVPQPLPSGPGANPLSRGEMAAFVFAKTPEPLPDITFTDGDGNPRSLKDWQGKVVLLNLWATWCAPCLKEMPALDELQREIGSDRFEVVALSVDRAGADGSRKFFDRLGVKSLAIYADPTSRATSKLKALGLPATLLIDAQGREVGRLTGPAEWASDDAKRLIAAVQGS